MLRCGVSLGFRLDEAVLKGSQVFPINPNTAQKPLVVPNKPYYLILHYAIPEHTILSHIILRYTMGLIGLLCSPSLGSNDLHNWNTLRFLVVEDSFAHAQEYLESGSG